MCALRVESQMIPLILSITIFKFPEKDDHLNLKSSVFIQESLATACSIFMNDLTSGARCQSHRVKQVFIINQIFLHEVSGKVTQHDPNPQA
jgi:hypothetical protein